MVEHSSTVQADRQRAAQLRQFRHDLAGVWSPADGAAGRLGKKQSYRPVVPSTPEKFQARQAERYDRLRVLRGLSKKQRLKRCKSPIGASRVGLVAHQDGAHLTGVQSCANVWACPVCAPKIRAGRMTDVLEAVDRHHARGGGFAFLTLTVQHEVGEGLALLLELLGGAWKSVAEHREYKEWRKRLGVVGNIMALEVTDGLHGWHPHRHVMLFTAQPLTRNEIEAFEAVLDELYARWLRLRGRKAGVVDERTGRRVGVRLEYVDPRDGSRPEQLGRYITKLQAGFELTRADLKKSRHAAGRLPMDLIDEVAAGGDGAPAARARWQEYEAAMTGKSAVRFSKGLRAHLGMEKAKTDEQLAEEEVGGEAGLYLSAPLYRRLFRDGHVPAVLGAYAGGGAVDVLKLVHLLYPGKYVADDREFGGVLLLQ